MFQPTVKTVSHRWGLERVEVVETGDSSLWTMWRLQGDKSGDNSSGPGNWEAVAREWPMSVRIVD